MVLLPLCYGAETTQIWCYHHSNFNFSKVSIWHHDHSNMVISPFPLFNFSSVKILKEYLYTFKIIINSDGSLLFQKRDYDLNSTLYSEGTYIIEGTMFLRHYGLKNTLNSEGTEKRRWREERLINTSQEREKRERVPDNSMKLFGVIFELSGVLLYIDFVTILAKIATAVTEWIRLKWSLSINQFNNTCGLDQKKQIHKSGGNKLLDLKEV